MTEYRKYTNNTLKIIDETIMKMPYECARDILDEICRKTGLEYARKTIGERKRKLVKSGKLILEGKINTRTNAEREYSSKLKEIIKKYYNKPWEWVRKKIKKETGKLLSKYRVRNLRCELRQAGLIPEPSKEKLIYPKDPNECRNFLEERIRGRTRSQLVKEDRKIYEKAVRTGNLDLIGKKSYSNNYVVTVEDLTKAIQANVGKTYPLEEKEAEKMAEHVLDFFGFDDYIIDNVLGAKDRNVFYMLEDYDLLKPEKDITTIKKGKPWRINYWKLNKEKIYELANKPEVKDEVEADASIYDILPDEIWERVNANITAAQTAMQENNITAAQDNIGAIQISMRKNETAMQENSSEAVSA